MRKNQVFTAEIEHCTVEGYGVCRVENRAVFVQGALPGEVWEILILKVSSSVVWAKGLHLLSASPERIPNDCPNPCGGCTLRHAGYEKELKIKKEHIESCVKRIGQLEMTLNAVHPSTEINHYRNKAVFAVGSRDGKAVFGFYRPHSHEIVPIDQCPLQSNICVLTAKTLTSFLNEHRISPYEESSGRGTVRHLFFRESSCGEAVACIVSARGFGSQTQELVEYLRNHCPFLTGIVLNINKTKGNTILAGEFYPLWGEPNLTESFGGYHFQISPQSFLQVNPKQANLLYGKAVEFAYDSSNPAKNQMALELYSGAGTISLCLSKKFHKVIGTEIVPEAVENARINAVSNNVENVEFICADAAQIAQQFSDLGLQPDAVIVDPPRKGLTESVIQHIIEMSPERICYISCNPATLARDLRLFVDGGYRLNLCEAYDMFPRTGHVETVVLMSRVEGK